MIYTKKGEQVAQGAFNVYGREIGAAYSVDGMQIYPPVFNLKVMSYNVGGWYKGSGTNVPTAQKEQYLALQTGMIEDNDPDVLVIQEYLANFAADGTSALSLLQGLFPYVHVKTSGTYFGRAICSKYPITNYVERTYTQESSRYFDSCTITAYGVPITFVNTHLGLTQANRDPEIVQLIAYLQTLTRFIACGDYNTSITTNDKTAEVWTKNIKPFLDEGFQSANCDDAFYFTCSDYPDGTWWGCLDNIITSANITLDDAHVDETKKNDQLADRIDHMPFIAELTIN